MLIITIYKFAVLNYWTSCVTGRIITELINFVQNTVFYHTAGLTTNLVFLKLHFDPPPPPKVMPHALRQ